MDSPYGKGIMYVTTNAIILEQKSKGIFFERLHSQIASVEATDKKHIKISWPEGRQMFDYTFKIKDAKERVKEIVEKHNYEDNFPDLMGVNSVVLTEKEQKEIIEKRLENTEKNISKIQKQLDEANLKLNMIASDDPDKANKILEAADETKKIHDILEMWTQYKKDISNIVMNRSKKISKDIPNYKCWNDCWFDNESKCFITFNKFWSKDDYKEFEGPKKFYETNTIPNAYAIPGELIRFTHGYPACILFFDKNDLRDGLIPSITDEMLNDEIISKKFGLDKDVNYPTLMKKGTLTYNTSPGSKLILKNSVKYRFTRKETIFFLNRKMIPENEIPLLP